MPLDDRTLQEYESLLRDAGASRLPGWYTKAEIIAATGWSVSRVIKFLESMDSAGLLKRSTRVGYNKFNVRQVQYLYAWQSPRKRAIRKKKSK